MAESGVSEVLYCQLSKNTTLSNSSKKNKFIKKPESCNTRSLQPRCLWVLTFCWLVHRGAVCVWAGVAKGPGEQREARENINEAGQKSQRHKKMHEFLALIARRTMSVEP